MAQIEVRQPLTDYMRPVNRLGDAQPPEMLIEGFLPKGGFMVLASAPFAGKTNLALELTRALHTQKPFLGKFAVAPRTIPYRILWIEQDTDPAYFRRDFARIVGPIYEPDEAYQSLPWAQQEIYTVFLRRHWLSDPTDLAQLAADASANTMEIGVDEDDEQYRSFDVIVIDTLSSVIHMDFDGNNNSHMTTVCHNAKWLSKQTGAAVILLHHFNKAQSFQGRPSTEATLDRIRGASAIAAEADVIIGLEQRKHGEQIKLSLLKNRPAPDLRDFEYYVEYSPEKITFSLESSAPGCESFRRAWIIEKLVAAMGAVVDKTALVEGLMTLEKATDKKVRTYENVVADIVGKLKEEKLVDGTFGRYRWIGPVDRSES